MGVTGAKPSAASSQNVLSRTSLATIVAALVLVLTVVVPTAPARAAGPANFGGLQINFDVEGVSNPPQAGEQVKLVYTLTNTGKSSMWWRSSKKDKEPQEPRDILEDALCADGQMEFIEKSRVVYFPSTQRHWHKLRAGTTWKIACHTTLPKSGPFHSYVTVKNGEFDRGVKFGPYYTQRGIEVTLPAGELKVTIPGEPRGKGSTTSVGQPDWALTKSADKTYVEPGGEDVTYTYRVENRSEGNLYYGSMKDDKCWPLKPVEQQVDEPGKNSMATDRFGQYLEPGGYAEWTCTTHVSDRTIGIVEASFKDPENNVSRAAAATHLGVRLDLDFQGADFGISRCDVIDFSTQNVTTGVGNLGSFVPGNVALGSKPIPQKGSPVDSKRRRGQITTASATSGQFPGYVYYAAKSVNDPNMGLYRIKKDDPKSIERVTPPHTMVDHRDGDTQSSGATFTNRLGFGPDGRLWSLNQQGRLFSLDIDPNTGLAAGEWKLYGEVTTDASFSDEKETSFADWSLGDVAIDGNNVMWITASRMDVGRSDSRGANSHRNRAGTFLFSLALNQVLQENQERPQVDHWMRAQTKAHYVSEVKFKGDDASARGFYGLAFAPNGELYSVYDPSDGDASNLNPARVFTIDLVTGEAKFQFESEAMTGSQDLSSCAFPKPALSVEKTSAKIVKDPEDGKAGKRQVEFTITVRNSGNLAAPGVVLTDQLENYVPGSATLNGKSIADVDGQSPFHNGKALRSPDADTDLIHPGQAAVVTIRANVETLGTEVCNTAQAVFGVGKDKEVYVSDDPTKPGADDKTCEVFPYLKVEKTGGQIQEVDETDPHFSELKVGNGNWFKATYDITVSNPGKVNAAYRQVTDVFKHLPDLSDAHVDGLPQNVVVKSYWSGEGSDGKDIAVEPDKALSFPLGSDKRKVLEPEAKETYKVMLYFKPAADFDWREKIKEICNSATVEGDVDLSKNTACTVPPQFRGLAKLRKAAVDPKSNKIEILKDLGGAEFALYPATKEDPEKVDVERKIRDITTADPFEIRKGTYFLVETKAPAGLSLLPAPVKFTVVEKNGKLLVDSADNLSLTIENPQGDNKNSQEGANVATITVNDIYSGSLPVTGDSGVLPVVVLGGFLAIIAGMLTRRA